METYLHGECVITRTKNIPAGVNRVKAKNKSYLLADSETTGNYHLLEEKEGVELYEKNGILYLKNEVPVDVFCAVKDRHDNITLSPGTWEIDKALEHDYLTGMKRQVAD